MGKPSLQNALHSSIVKKNQPSELVTKKRQLKKLIVEIPAEAHYQIDQMRLELRRNSIKELVTEALNDLFKKYDYPPIT
jgi:hypothetical protein